MLWTINIILGCFLLFMVATELRIYILRRKSAKYLSPDEFREGMRKAQVIDVRESVDFDAGHILGARNLSYQTKIKQAGLDDYIFRKDQPIYVYSNDNHTSILAANRIRKAGYQDIFILKGGYSEWTGKVKKKNLD
ncbi:rhodanese-related sulfurtransferase [Enterococcus sp. PF1-24]|uniref:rhodanese-like domain-containing protein n=1 Tax=unclassified Enterococcus TaxID=2608891 RepID=UPI0024730E9E|nr:MULTISPECIES: rhodanese-like domain-containing protein [unclassified Enterococcus]MDH6365286.1 rhodanese-related sulfurtransferase [Enterococcus sp. PFB1-1]MDH6402384.1 rhodanese-related sulfurtransferase [Enterococcus sp. PF1-24]